MCERPREDYARRRTRETAEPGEAETDGEPPTRKWENSYIESFHDKFRDELLDRERFDTLYEARVLVAQWRREYNTVGPHSSLGYRPPAPEVGAWPRGARSFGALHTGNQLRLLAQ